MAENDAYIGKTQRLVPEMEIEVLSVAQHIDAYTHENCVRNHNKTCTPLYSYNVEVVIFSVGGQRIQKREINVVDLTEDSIASAVMITLQREVEQSARIQEMNSFKGRRIKLRGES